VFVGVKLTLKWTGELIECGEKNAKEDVEALETASGTDGQEEGIYYSWAMDRIETVKKCYYSVICKKAK